jgi:hypothetical protein
MFAGKVQLLCTSAARTFFSFPRSGTACRLLQGTNAAFASEVISTLHTRLETTNTECATPHKSYMSAEELDAIVQVHKTQWSTLVQEHKEARDKLVAKVHENLRMTVDVLGSSALILSAAHWMEAPLIVLEASAALTFFYGMEMTRRRAEEEALIKAAEKKMMLASGWYIVWDNANLQVHSHKTPLVDNLVSISTDAAMALALTPSTSVDKK